MTWTVLKIYFKPLMCSRTESVKQTEVRTHLLFGCSANPDTWQRSPKAGKTF